MARSSSEVLSVKIPRKVANRLRSIAKKSGRTKTEILLTALEHQLEREAESSAGSFLDAAQDLAGCIEGPSDLATKKRHLEGFGRS
jgi:predicted DNA-binding protein